MFDLPLQEASLDIWSKKYQLKAHDGTEIDKSVDETYQRVARALANVESHSNEEWYEKFLWALRNGAVGAGRIMSNVGAQAQKSSTSTINCCVSGTVGDSIEGILQSVKEAGITLSAGCGIGYDFTTLRPKGAYIGGVGATTGGALSFMDVFDSMCFTISSAGGRRGAQMGVLEICHPDIEEFIKAKREDGRLRQFNLSVLITDAFMECLKVDADWQLYFPVNKKENWKGRVIWRSWPSREDYMDAEGDRVLCKVYKTVKARDLWNSIMRATYDYAEPGFIMIDEANRMNNNYFCEKLRATNPCVSGDTLLLTDWGYHPIKELVNTVVSVWNGFEFSSVVPKVTGYAQKMRTVYTTEGNLTCTLGHVWVLEDGSRVATANLKPGDRTLPFFHPDSDYSTIQGQLSFKHFKRVIGCEILRIDEAPDAGVVYCVTEPKKHTAVFNGIMTGNCGEQFLPPYGSCLLGSINLTKFVKNPFTDQAEFDFDKYRKVVALFTRMLDNVVEINGLPLEEQRHEITHKRRHGMGYFGLGSAMTMLRMKYGCKESVEFTSEVTRLLAAESWYSSQQLAVEKGCAPIFNSEENRKLFMEGPYMQRIASTNSLLADSVAQFGARFTHATSIAPTGTIALSFGNNCSNGIEPSFEHEYQRNVIREGKKTKEMVTVYSYEALLFKQLFPGVELPDYFSKASTITPKEHVDIQAAAQYWVDASISKTINVPTDIPFEEFEGIYMYAYEKGLKGCTTFRFNPEAFQGVLVTNDDLEATTYTFTLENGETVELKGNEEIQYDGETHTAANLYDALKEGYYGKF